MSTVPYIFAGDTGNIPLSQLDANFANAKSAADYVIANVQANITGVGVLANLSVTGNINGTGATYYTGNGRLLSGIQATTVGILEELSVIGNITGGNVSAVGNVRTGNVRTTGQISAFGNVTGAYIKGNGSQLTGVLTSYNANLLTGNTLSGNVIFSNLTTVGTLANLTVATFVSANTFIADSYAGNLIETDTLISNNVQSNGNITATGIISTTGNITAARYFGNGQALTGVIATSVGTLPSLNVTGNVQAGNLVTSGNLTLGGRINLAGNVSAVGNITGNYILGNGALLTGITGGTSNAALLTGNTLSANVTQSSLTTVGTLNSLTVTGNINMSGALRDNNELNIVTTANNANIVFTPNGTGQVQVDSGLIVSNSISGATTISALGNIVTSGFFVGNFVGNIVANISNLPGPAGAVVYNNGSGNAAATAGLVYTTGPNALTILGNLVSDFVIANGIQGPLTTASQPNITQVGTLGSLSVTANTTSGNLLTGGLISATGNVSGGNLNVTGNIVDTGALTIVTGSNGNIALAPNGTGIVTASTSISVAGNVTANNYIGSGAGTPLLSSAVNLDLSSPTAVRVIGGGSLRLPNLTAAQIANLVASNGDLVYNTTVNKIQGFENGAWGNLI
jgi:hypothetical protein